MRKIRISSIFTQETYYEPQIIAPMKRFIYILIMMAISIQGLMAQQVITVSGIVKQAYNKRALEYVNVYVPGTHIGTITNSDGEFTIKIQGENLPVTVEFSHLGYQTRRITVNTRNLEDQEILLTPGVIALNEIIVEPIYPSRIVESAMDNVKKNYSLEAGMYQAFYREFAQKRRKYINISEAVVDVYKTPYTQEMDRDRVRVQKGRRMVSPNASDTLNVKLEGGPVIANSLDVVKTPGMLLGFDYMTYYQYDFKDFVIINDKLHYAIDFKPRVNIENIPLYRGTLYIEQKTHAISRIEFSMDMSDRDKVTSYMLRKKPAGLRFRPTSISYLVTYRQDGERYYLNYVRAELKFNCDWKRKLFATSYTVVSEIVMTNREDAPASGNIPYRESFMKSQVLSDKVQDFYDEKFWEDYNIIEPTESLEYAVKRLKKAND